MNLDELMAENAALRDQVAAHNKILNCITDGVLVSDAKGNIIHYNTAAAPLMESLNINVGASESEWKESPIFYSLDGVNALDPSELPLARALGGESLDNSELFVRAPNMPDGIWTQSTARPMLNADGSFRGAVVIFRDVTERKRAEREMERQLARERERNDLLERMRRAMEELSTPILEVWDDVLAVPVIGLVDSQRAAEMMQRVLEAVERRQCRFLILDITGVDVIDTATADRFMKLATATEILGAQVFLTGARAVVASAIASIGMELKGMRTLRNLKHGLSECMRIMEATSRQQAQHQVGQGRG